MKRLLRSQWMKAPPKMATMKSRQKPQSVTGQKAKAIKMRKML